MLADEHCTTCWIVLSELQGMQHYSHALGFPYFLKMYTEADKSVKSELFLTFKEFREVMVLEN